MRAQSVLILIAAVSAAFAAADSSTTAVATVQSDVEDSSRVLVADHKHVKRALRRYIPDELESDDKEDRGVGVKVGKTQQLTSKWDALILKNLDELSGKAVLAAKLKDKYDDAFKLSMSTLKQLDDVEARRVKDIATYSKETGKSMRREIKPFDGIKIAPAKFLESHVGRGNQRYGPDGSRLLSAAVVSRPKNQGGGDVLLISSSNPNKGDWLLPKGGWDKGEDVETAALREVMEEGGVNAQLLHSLGEWKFLEGEKKYTYYPYSMRSITEYDDWAESARYRIWVRGDMKFPQDDAIMLLAKRPHMANIVKKAKEIDGKIKANKLAESGETIRKFSLNPE